MAERSGVQTKPELETLAYILLCVDGGFRSFSCIGNVILHYAYTKHDNSPVMGMGLLTDFRIIRIEFLTREMAEKGELFVFCSSRDEIMNRSRA